MHPFTGLRTRAAHTALFAVVFALSATGSVISQISKDPLVEEANKTLRDLTTQSALQNDPAYREASAKWKDYDFQIHQAEKEQDDALSGTVQQISAIVELYRSRAVGRNTALDHHLFARVMGLRNELDQAYDHFRTALKLDPFFFWSWDGLGVYYMRKENWSEAAECFRNAVRINPVFSRSVFGLAQSYLRLQNLTEAKRCVTEAMGRDALRRDSEFMLKARMHLAEIHRSEGNFAAAIEELSRIVDAGSKDIMVFQMRAHCSKKLERFGDAAQDYEKILEMAPKELRFLVEISNCYRRLGRNADAANSLERYLESAGDLGGDVAASMRDQIQKLRALPPVENPKNQKLFLPDWMNRLRHHDDVQKRREAINVLSQAPIVIDGNQQATRDLNEVILRALLDDDGYIRAKAVEQIGFRMWWKEDLNKIWKFLVKDSDPRVRAMTHFVLPQWTEEDGETRPGAVPFLMKGIEDDDKEVFWQAHESLNRVTLAFVDRVLPSEITPEQMASTRKKWSDWYAKNRDVYRKYEPAD